MRRYIPFFSDKDIVKIYESVIKPEAYMKEILRTFDKIDRLSFKNMNGTMIAQKLSILFWKNKIKFIYEDKVEQTEEQNEYGINSAATLTYLDGSIGVFINENIKKILDPQVYTIFKKWLLLNLKHELIHRQQGLKIKDKKIKAKVFSLNSDDRKTYLGNKHEVMARAWEIVELFRLYGFTDLQIRDIIKYRSPVRNTVSALSIYDQIFSHTDPIYRLLHKYMYQYLED